MPDVTGDIFSVCLDAKVVNTQNQRTQRDNTLKKFEATLSLLKTSTGEKIKQPQGGWVGKTNNERLQMTFGT